MEKNFTDPVRIYFACFTPGIQTRDAAPFYSITAASLPKTEKSENIFYSEPSCFGEGLKHFCDIGEELITFFQESIAGFVAYSAPFYKGQLNIFLEMERISPFKCGSKYYRHTLSVNHASHIMQHDCTRSTNFLVTFQSYHRSML